MSWELPIRERDLLEQIAGEIAERLRELRPAMEEHERLLDAAEALEREGAVGAAASAGGASRRRGSGRRGSAAGAIGQAAAPRGPRVSVRGQEKPPRNARGAAQQAILAALEHGSHTVSELAVVTAMSGPTIRENLRRLQAAGQVTRAKREGKAAYALS